MKPQLSILLSVLLACLLSAPVPSLAAADTAASPRAPAPRPVELTTSDGTRIKGSYFAAAGQGPAVLLFHQSNRTRASWDAVGLRLAAAGIHTLTIDSRGHGESGGTNGGRGSGTWASDLETAFQFLVSQAGVERELIGIGGAGALGVDNSVETARRHPAEVKSLALLSGETLQENLRFLHNSARLPGLYVVADDDEYPPTVEAMELLYITSSSPAKKLVHYPALREAPWVWYETSDIGKVPAGSGHGTDMFSAHPELPGIIVDWFVTTLLNTPGHAPADTVAAAAIIDELRAPGGVAELTRRLAGERRTDPEAQLFPEITVSIVGQDHLRAGEPALGVEVFELLTLAYPASADAHESLAEGYLKNGQPELARREAERALALLDSHAHPASSWTDTEAFRGEIRAGAQQVLHDLASPH